MKMNNIKSELMFNVIDGDLFSIYLFYKENQEQSVPIRLDSDSYLLENTELMHHFGLYESDYNGELSKKYYLLILNYESFNSEIELMNAIELQQKNAGDNRFTHCIIEHDYRSDMNVTLLDHAYKLFKILPRLKILNSDLLMFYDDMKIQRRDNNSVEYYRKNMDGYNFINLFPYMNKYNCNSVDTADSIRNLVAMTKEIIDLGNRNGRVVFYYKNDSLDVEIPRTKIKNPNLYLQIGAYLTYTYGYRFIVLAEDKAEYYKYVSQLTSNNFLYASDFLTMVFDPPEIGFIDKNIPCICLRDNYKLYPKNLDNKRDYRKYSLDLFMAYTEFDLESRSIIGNEIHYGQFSYHFIKTIHFNRIYNLRDDNYSKSLKELKELNSLMRKFEGMLVHSGYANLVINKLIDYTNTIIFSNNGKVYLGYLAYIDGEIPYMLLPIADNYKPFYVNFSINQSENLTPISDIMDINILFDHDELISKFLEEGYISGKSLHYKLPDYLKYSSLYSIVFNSSVISECGVTIEDLGIWSTTSLQFRAYAQYSAFRNKIIEKCDIGTLRTEEILTFFGGPNPALKVNFKETPEIWR